VTVFESEIAAASGAAFGIGTNSGALRLALPAAGAGPGDEVVTTPFTFIATVAAIGYSGATPVFADIDRRTCNIDPARIETAITPRRPTTPNKPPRPGPPQVEPARRRNAVTGARHARRQSAPRDSTTAFTVCNRM
jgi:hypothetical protein